jgi:recombinational DNA repair protein (RecF pathway)
MNDFLEQLKRRITDPALLFAFELKLLNEFGLEPDLAEASLSAGAKEIARNLLQKDFGFATRLKLTDSQLTELKQFLHGFLIFHLGKVPKSRAALLKDS